MKLPGFQGENTDRTLAAVVGSLLILSVALYAWILDGWFPDSYYPSVQEDEALEWATFWAFVCAGAAFIVATINQRRAGIAVPWFFAGVALFCFFVAGEEISWGQRIVGYRPPAYFLENNFQQELNLHNITASDLRRQALKAVIALYGIVLPIISLVPVGGRLLRRLNVSAPSWLLIPGFIGTYAIYKTYPWKFSGEWVEFMLGLGFLFAGLAHVESLRSKPLLPRLKWGATATVAIAWVVMILAGFANASLSRALVANNPEQVAAAQMELEALQQDFLSDEVGTRCNMHKRLYTFRTAFSQNYLLEGEFAKLIERGLPESRMEFLLDPWNSPYWLRDRCNDDDERITFIYSFGPDRRRQSSRWEVLGDDVGVYLNLSE